MKFTPSCQDFKLRKKKEPQKATKYQCSKFVRTIVAKSYLPYLNARFSVFAIFWNTSSKYEIHTLPKLPLTANEGQNSAKYQRSFHKIAENISEFLPTLF